MNIKADCNACGQRRGAEQNLLSTPLWSLWSRIVQIKSICRSRRSTAGKVGRHAKPYGTQ
jgi:hypothetical protein